MSQNPKMRPTCFAKAKEWACGLFLILVSGLVPGCASPPFHSYVVYENPTAFVRLEISPWADIDFPQTWNAHPSKLSHRQIHKALEGLRVREHRAAPIRWVRGTATMEPAFHSEEIELLIAPIMEGLELAGPQELVTFYVSHPLNATKREVTSGGLYLTEGQLHIILSNYRAIFEIPPAGLIYDKRFPLFSLGPLGVDILHEVVGKELVLAEHEGLFDAIFGDERNGEIVLALSGLAMMQM